MEDFNIFDEAGDVASEHWYARMKEALEQYLDDCLDSASEQERQAMLLTLAESIEGCGPTLTIALLTEVCPEFNLDALLLSGAPHPDGLTIPVRIALLELSVKMLELRIYEEEDRMESIEDTLRQLLG